jgi:hypothetical protein
VADFQLEILNPYYRNRKLPAALLHFTAGFLLLNGCYEALEGGYSRAVVMAFLLPGLAEIVFTFFAGRLQKSHPVPGAVLRLVSAAAFLLYAGLLFRGGHEVAGMVMAGVTAAFVLIFFVEKRWSRPFIIRVNEEGVWFPRAFSAELFPWDVFNHVILRGGLLTLDFRDNRIVQPEVKALTATGDEDFNAFCREHTRRPDTVSATEPFHP